MMDKIQEVRDGDRRLQFKGVEIAHSTSKNSRSNGRWIEFTLYHSEHGNYVLSRTGQTRYVHAVDCAVAERNNLDVVDIDVVGSLDGLYLCDDCHIDVHDDLEFCPEVPRYWAMKLAYPEDVVQALHKRDDNGNMYLTNVARTLLRNAAEVDQEISEAYYNDTI